MSVERLSLNDATLIAGYAENIQRYAFASQHCKGKRVLDAGCGNGYGAFYLADNGAKSVLAVDNSQEAIEEAKTHYRHANLCYKVYDLERSANAVAASSFDLVVNFENVAHLKQPERLMELVSRVLSNGSTFIISTPNGETSAVDDAGKPFYRFQHKVYTSTELDSLLSKYFDRVTMYGQWLTHAGMLHKFRAKEIFDQLCESYYNPMSRLGRSIKRLTGRTSVPPPVFRGAADSFPGDHDIRPLNSNAYPWAPRTLLAVCERS